MGLEIAKQMLAINIFAFIMIFMLNINYFTKERVKKIEHKVFSYTLLSSLVLSLLGIVFGFLSLALNDVNFIVILFAKLYSISLIINVFFFTFYVYIISSKTGDNLEKYFDCFLELGLQAAGWSTAAIANT